MRNPLRCILIVSVAAGICAIVAASAGGLSNGATPSAPDPNNIVTVAVSTQFAESAIPIVVRAGDQFTITMSSNVTTGYGWQMSNQPSSKILTKVGSKYNGPQNPQLIGAGGTETWTFKAAGKGKQSIEMVYVRPWEKGVAPARKQVFEVTVL